MIVSIIAAYSLPDRVIGLEGRIPWHLPSDLARFKALTMGHTLVMGHRTYDSLEGQTLPGRNLIVLARGQTDKLPGNGRAATSLEAGLALAAGEFNEDELFIAGGETVYNAVLERGLVDRMYLTLVHSKFEGDTHFPAFEADRWREIARQDFPADESNRQATTFRFLKVRRSLSPAG